MIPAKLAFTGALVGALGLSLATRDASGDALPCPAWDVDYLLAANLELRDTPMGAGDGQYKIGPGNMTLRFEDRGGLPGGRAKLLAYAMREHFQIVSKNLFWTTTVTTDTHTAATPDRCWSAAEGVLEGRTFKWTTPVRGYKTDGSLTCDGSLCGKFGAPPAGTSALHIEPHDVTLGPLAFGEDGKTFKMASTFVTKTDMPKQTGYLTLAARELRRTCVQPKACP
jgi:hypothetical protein